MPALKKLYALELEKERLIVKLEEWTCSLKELKVEKKLLKNKVKTLVSELDKFNLQLCAFSKWSKKFDNTVKIKTYGK